MKRMTASSIRAEYILEYQHNQRSVLMIVSLPCFTLIISFSNLLIKEMAYYQNILSVMSSLNKIKTC